jgi:integrase
VASRIFSPKVPKERDANISRDADGTFRVDVRFKRSTGEPFRKQVRGIDSKTDARKKRDEFYEEFNVLEGGEGYAKRLVVVEEKEDKGPTVGSWCDECVAVHWPRRVPATMKDYAQAVRDHIKPALGDVPLRELNGRRITDWVYNLKDKEVLLNPRSKEKSKKIKLSVSSLKAAKAALSSALSLAVDEGVIGSNPALGLRIKWSVIDQERRRERQIAGEPEDMPDKRLLSVEEVETLLSKAKGSTIYPTLLLQSKCGLRIAEALAVRMEDIDMQRHVLRIRRQLKWVVVDGKERLMLEDLKTKSSRRDIPLPESVRSFLRGRGNTSGPLTKNGDDGWLDPRKAQTLVTKAFRDAGLCDVPGKPDPTSHNLRFFWTSHLLNDLKQPVTVVSRLAGHSQISTTLSYYSEATMSNMEEAMKLIA